MADKLKFWSGKLLSKPVVVLISGKAGVGKDTSADYIAKRLMTINEYTCLRASFATSLKEIARGKFGWDEVKDTKGRKLLQDIGRIGRDYDPDILVRKLIHNYYDLFPDFIIVSDWRFPNEKEYIEKLNSFQTVTIRIEAPDREVLKGTPEYFDLSELSLPSGYNVCVHHTMENGYEADIASIYYDFVVDNTRTFDDLYKQLDNILVTLIGE